MVAVNVAIPVVPGVSAGLEAPSTKSAEPGPLFTVDGPALLDGVGSGVAEVTLEPPPVKAVTGAAPEGNRTGMSKATEAPSTIGPATTQAKGPLGIGPVQPAGSETISTPVGGV